MHHHDRRRARQFRALWCGVDASAWCAALFLATWVRLDFTFPQGLVSPILAMAAVAAVGHVVVGHVIGPYVVGHRRGSYEEIVDLARTVSLVGAATFVWALTSEPVIVPRGVPVSAAALSLIIMLSVRVIGRSLRARLAATRTAERRVLVFGAGEAGQRLVRAMLRESNGGYVPVALLDDDPAKARLRAEGVRVRGTREAIAVLAERHRADTLVVAVPDADPGLLRDLAARAAAADLQVLSLPPLRDLMGASPTTHDLRDLDVADLLGRGPVALDTAVIAQHITGRSVLITGAGGSIGSELCVQISRFGPARIVLLDRDESGLHATQLLLTGQGLLDSDDIVLADIRDADSLRAVFEHHRPEVVFHAAALKHLPLLEAYPLEAFKTNVLGTLNVLSAAAAVGVRTFVNISTDKAADPTCVLGYSKRMAERLTADFASRHPGRYVSVRFGNVLGSRGSVVHAFRSQIERGGPVTVTHPEVRRYFMLIPEACQLVLEAAAIGSDGEVMVLDMGEQVSILEVARTMISMSGRTGIDVVFTGLRPGEKLAEDLFCPDESRRRTAHPLIESVDVPPMDANDVRHLHFDSPVCSKVWMRDRALEGQRSQGATTLHPGMVA